MENTEMYRHFLICNQLANKMLGHEPQNFAELILEEDTIFMNKQMTSYFYHIDEFFSELKSNDPLMCFEELGLETLAELSIEEIEKDFKNYCGGLLTLKYDESE